MLCERLELERSRVLAWCEVHAVLSALWHLEDASVDDDPRADILAALRVADVARSLG